MGEQNYRIPEGSNLERIIRNPVEEAVFDVLGGIPEAARAMGVQRGTIYYLLESWPLTDKRTAVKIEAATSKAGRRIPAAELLDLPGNPWKGPERHDTASATVRGKRRSSASRTRKEQSIRWHGRQPAARRRAAA